MKNNLKKTKNFRNINGILLLDKPRGITSNAVLQKVKYLFQAQKAGHCGTLDPLASGLLPICFGEATKFSRFLLDSTKGYTVTAALGATTDSGDCTGQILETYHVPELSIAKVTAALNLFKGQSMQVPPMFSAIKQNGQPLYKLARKGISVERKSRAIEIYQLELNNLNQTEASIELNISCSKGTYIRTLVEDLGKALGCGAHVKVLRRTGAGPYSIVNAITLEQIENLDFADLESVLLPVSSMLQGWQELAVNEEIAVYLQQGKVVEIANTTAVNDWVAIYTMDHAFLGMGEVLADGRVAPKRLMQQDYVSKVR